MSAWLAAEGSAAHKGKKEGGAAPRLLRRLPPGYFCQQEGQGVVGLEAAR